MNTIKIKYSLSTDAPPSLEKGEIAYSEASKTFFIGESDGTVVKLISVSDLTTLNELAENLQFNEHTQAEIDALEQNA